MVHPGWTGNIKIRSFLNTENGEYYFMVRSRSGAKNVTRKCLYDALSDFGINYEKAKKIVKKYAKTADTFSEMTLEITDLKGHVHSAAFVNKDDSNE